MSKFMTRGWRAVVRGRGAILILLASEACLVDPQGPATDAGREPPDAEEPEFDDAYTACRGDFRACAMPNTNCAAYTSDPENTFCAPLCEHDSDCPTLDGFRSACNFAWCAVLCDEGACPEGMFCLRHNAFIDSSGAAQGFEDVCVTEPTGL